MAHLTGRMIDRTKKLPARFYVSPTGRNPVRESHCAPLGHGLWEVRSDLDGNRIARVIFCMGDGHMILLHGFIKKTRKTPQQDIDLALKRKREVT